MGTVSWLQCLPYPALRGVPLTLMTAGRRVGWRGSCHGFTRCHPQLRILAALSRVSVDVSGTRTLYLHRVQGNASSAKSQNLRMQHACLDVTARVRSCST